MVWVISFKVDLVWDVFILLEIFFDSFDFVSEKIGLGGCMGIDVIIKIFLEMDYEWGEVLEFDLVMVE